MTSRVAAFDLGSGSLKLLIADQLPAGFRTHMQIARSIPFKRSMEGSGTQGSIGNSAMKMGREVMGEFMEIAKREGVKRYAGVATEAFREAVNGSSYVAELSRKFSVPLHLITQEEEGRLALVAAAAAAQKREDQVVAWDVGSGSFQMALRLEDTVKMYGSKVGYMSALTTLEREVRRDFGELKPSPHPVSLDEAHRLIEKLLNKLEPLPKWFPKLSPSSPLTVCGIGTREAALFIYPSHFLKRDHFTADEVMEVICEQAGQEEALFSEVFDYPDRVMVSLCLCYSVMRHFQYPKVHFTPTCGTTEGILSSPKYWVDRA